MPNSSVLTATSRTIANPKSIGFPLARTTRMPVAIRPNVFPFVRAISAGAYSSATIEMHTSASSAPTVSDTTPTPSLAKNPTENGAVIAISSSRAPKPMITPSITCAHTRDHQPASTYCPPTAVRRTVAATGGPPAPGGGALV